jgi:hypothetical protein
MSIVTASLLLPGCGEGLAGATARPNRSVAPAGELEGERPSADAGEEVALLVTIQVRSGHVLDVSGIDESIGDLSSLHQLSEPCRSKGVVLVVVDAHDSSICLTLCSRSQSQHCACCSSHRIFRQPDINAPSGLLTRVDAPQEHRSQIRQSMSDAEVMGFSMMAHT